MAWQGIPFSIEKMEQVVTSSVQAAHIVLDKVPAIIVDTPFAWDTIAGAFIAGSIPGIISYLALRNSYQLAKMQHAMQSKEKINNEIRVAAAAYVTAINYLSTDYNAWVKDIRERRIYPVSKESMPDHIRENIFRTESNKNLLTLLIIPGEDGYELLEAMGNVQNALTPFLEAEATYKDNLQLRTSVNNFLYKCHEYFLRD
ncbi:hypothetical protein GKU51_07815 [Salmonella enterica]|nr:hypothetical protein [Salmonella enterica]EDT3043544.1 hypothetical protein [Salmonella enterica subsp. enterica serovar 6,7:k:-]EBC4404117.1 hypothetical protein [Salmonella enterica]EBK8416454.1 hypothetical protein [Salmonella enterica]ECF6151127.1 hypothetical protein [Salmonella enterica]